MAYSFSVGSLFLEETKSRALAFKTCIHHWGDRYSDTGGPWLTADRLVTSLSSDGATRGGATYHSDSRSWRSPFQALRNPAMFVPFAASSSHIYGGFVENWRLFPVFGKTTPIRNLLIHLMTAAKKVVKSGQSHDWPVF